MTSNARHCGRLGSNPPRQKRHDGQCWRHSLPLPPHAAARACSLPQHRRFQCPAGRGWQSGIQRDRGPVVVAEVGTHPRQHEMERAAGRRNRAGPALPAIARPGEVLLAYRPVPDFVPLGKVRRFDPLSRNPSLGFGFCFEPMKACHAALIEHMHRHAAPIVGTDSVSRHARNMAEVSGRSRQHRPPSLGNRAAHPADLAMSIIFSMTVVGLARLGIGSPGLKWAFIMHLVYAPKKPTGFWFWFIILEAAMSACRAPFALPNEVRSPTNNSLRFSIRVKHSLLLIRKPLRRGTAN